MFSEQLARAESKYRCDILELLLPEDAVRFYSLGRRLFLKLYSMENPPLYKPPEEFARTLWGIKHQGPLMNAAGMFKNGEAYNVAARQGAGGYMGGTGTWNRRSGNEKDGIRTPFVPLPGCKGSLNWLGLNNDGDEINSQRATRIVEEKVDGCPVWWSLMASPDIKGEEKQKKLVAGMILYDRAGVDVLEINESCQNVKKDKDDDLVNRLRYVKHNFLDRRQRRIPVVVKFSSDTQREQIPFLMDTLFDLGYDGINLGNTSTDYQRWTKDVVRREKKVFDYFTKTFGGSFGGQPIRDKVLPLIMGASQYLEAGPPSQEFHIIRTGGVDDGFDVWSSDTHGASLSQWFTGHWHVFSYAGHKLYENMYEEYKDALESEVRLNARMQEDFLTALQAVIAQRTQQPN